MRQQKRPHPVSQVLTAPTTTDRSWGPNSSHGLLLAHQRPEASAWGWRLRGRTSDWLTAFQLRAGSGTAAGRPDTQHQTHLAFVLLRNRPPLPSRDGRMRAPLLLQSGRTPAETKPKETGSIGDKPPDPAAGARLPSRSQTRLRLAECGHVTASERPFPVPRFGADGLLRSQTGGDDSGDGGEGQR